MVVFQARDCMMSRMSLGISEISNLLKKLIKFGISAIFAGTMMVQTAPIAEAKELTDRSVKVLMDYDGFLSEFR